MAEERAEVEVSGIGRGIQCEGAQITEKNIEKDHKALDFLRDIEGDVGGGVNGECEMLKFGEMCG